MSNQVILAAYGPQAKDTAGQICKFDLTTGIALGLTYKEYSPPMESEPVDDATLTPTNCSVATVPSRRLDLQTSYMVALSGKTASLNYYSLGKEKPVQRFFGQDRLVSVAVSPDGQLLAAGNSNGHLCLWQMSTGEMLARIETAHLQDLSVLRFSVDGALLVSASLDGSIKVWGVAQVIGAPSTNPILTIRDHNASIKDVRFGFGFDRACRLLTASLDGSVNVYDLVDGLLLASFSFPSPINCVLMDSTESTIYAGGLDGKIYLVDLQQPPPNQPMGGGGYGLANSEMSLAGHHSPLVSLAFSLEEALLVSGEANGTIIVWNTRSRQMMRRIDAPTKSVGRLCWLHIVSKSSIETSPVGKFDLMEAPKRATAADPSLLLVPTSAPVGAPAATPFASDNPTPSVPDGRTDDDLELRQSYLRLLDFVTRHLINS